MSGKKILLIAQSSGKHGGTEYDLFTLFNFLKQNNKISIICPEGERFEYYKSYSEEIVKTRFNVFPLITFKLRSFIRYCAIFLIEYKELKCFIKKNKFDIAIVNSTVCFLYIGILRKCNVKTVTFLRENIRSSWLREIVYRYIQLNSDRVVAISKSIYDHFAKSNGDSKLELIYTNTDLNRLPTNMMNYKAANEISMLKILNIGGLCENKNQEILIRACQRLINRYNFELMFVGNVTEQKYYEKLMTLVSETKDDKLSYKFVEFKNKEELNAFYLESDFLVITSKSEGMSFVLLEALYHGKIIIGPPIGLVPELIIDGFNGFIYKTNDVNSLIETMIRAAESNRLSQISLEAKKTFEKFPTIDECLIEVDNLINEVLTRK
jgi:glycosyltransferase involved in cell wall biosynthesis